MKMNPPLSPSPVAVGPDAVGPDAVDPTGSTVSAGHWTLIIMMTCIVLSVAGVADRWYCYWGRTDTGEQSIAPSAVAATENLAQAREAAAAMASVGLVL